MSYHDNKKLFMSLKGNVEKWLESLQLGGGGMLGKKSF